MEKKKIEKKIVKTKKLYEKPKVVSEEVFETLALSCCKGDACIKYAFPRGLHGVS